VDFWWGIWISKMLLYPNRIISIKGHLYSLFFMRSLFLVLMWNSFWGLIYDRMFLNGLEMRIFYFLYLYFCSLFFEMVYILIFIIFMYFFQFNVHLLFIYLVKILSIYDFIHFILFSIYLCISFARKSILYLNFYLNFSPHYLMMIVYFTKVV
jgi:hypothetical protein